MKPRGLETMTTTNDAGGLLTRPSVGRKRKPVPKKVRESLAGKFGARLSALVDASGQDAKQFGEAIGKSDDTVRLYFAGRTVPPLNDWPRIAKALGLKSVRELLPE